MYNAQAATTVCPHRRSEVRIRRMSAESFGFQNNIPSGDLEFNALRWAGTVMELGCGSAYRVHGGVLNDEYVKMSPSELNDTDRLHGSASVLHDD